MTNYKNSFYIPDNPYSYEFLQCFKEPIEYKDHLIYRRVVSMEDGGNIYDVVKDNICIGMYAGLDGAKKFVDCKDGLK
jgi:hypothetical protein